MSHSKQNHELNGIVIEFRIASTQLIHERADIVGARRECIAPLIHLNDVCCVSCYRLHQVNTVIGKGCRNRVWPPVTIILSRLRRCI